MPFRAALRRQPFGRLALVAGLAICFGITVALWLATLTKLEELATSGTDNRNWTLNRLDVEYTQLRLALIRAEARPDADLAELRLAFDIFYSRAATIGEGSSYLPMTGSEEIAPSLARIEAYLQHTAALMDGPEEGLRAALPALVEATDALRADVRSIPLRGISILAERSDRQRQEIAALLLKVALVTLVLLVALSVLVLLLNRLNRDGLQRARESEEARARLDTIISSALEAIVVADSEGRIIEFNDAAEDMFGYARKAVLGRPLAEVLIPEHLRAGHNAGFARYRNTGEPQMIGKGRIQLEAQRADGQVFPVELSLARAQDESGVIFISFLRDISRQVASDAVKSSFLAVMSHEMRTPLNGLIGTLDLLEGTALTDAQRRYLRASQTSARLLLNHVNDVLDISRLDAGAETLARDRIELRQLLAEIAAGQRALAEASGNVIEIEVDPSVPPCLEGDARRLTQVLLNLVGNAVKFTRNGTIRLECEAGASGQDGRREVEFRIIDTGAGIDPAVLPRVFEDFVTLDPSFGRPANGTGLGLGIARRIVTAMGGEIGAESELGEGSVFWVSLPMSTAPCVTPAAEVAEAVEPALPPCRVLVVEDNEINRFVAREMLNALGHEVVEAVDGPSGAAAAAAERFDAILMDISMPGRSGIDTAREIRGSGGPNARTPIIALTAHALPQDISTFTAAGMAATLTKPLIRRDLAAVMDRLLGPAARAAARPASALLDLGALDDLTESLGPGRAAALLTRFLDEGDALFSTLPQAGGRRAIVEAMPGLHRISGSAALFGARALREQLALIETRWKTEAAPVGPADLAALVPLWAGTRDALIRACAEAAEREGAILQAGGVASPP